MSWNGSGTFNRLFSWVADKNAGLDISSTRMDTDTNDIASNGFGNCLTRDGQGSATANLPMNSFRHTGVQDGAARTDYGSLGQVQDGLVNWVVAGGSADAITATYSPAVTALKDGELFFVRASAANATTTPTFAPNGLTAHTITKAGGSALSVGDIPGNLAEIVLRYNLSNTRYELLNPAVNSASLLQTGDMIFNAVGGARTGWVRANGLTIGSASSGGTERANADTVNLYTYLWNGFSNAICPVSGGRGGSAASDFAANKTITLLDYRGRSPFGVDDMGNSAAGRLTGGTFGTGNATTAGSSGGEAAHTLTTAELAVHSHANTLTDNGHLHSLGATVPTTTPGGNGFQSNGLVTDITQTQTATTGITISNANAGSGNSHNTMPPFGLGTWFLKL